MASARKYFSKVAYSVDWNITEKFAWLFVIALKDADAAQRTHWLDYVRNRVLHRTNQERVEVA